MEICGESLDEILIEAYSRLQKLGVSSKGARGDPYRELIGVLLRIKHPRARLSRSNNRGLPFSALGELLWYLTRSDDVSFITAYIPAYKDEVGESGRINGAYGPRLFSTNGLDQIEGVTNLLRRKPSTKRAVIQLYRATDLLTDEEVPCTTTLQFFVQDGSLHLAASLRSNDAYLGLPHDVFCFTMLQEMMAARLDLELGEYIQMVGNFHLYDKHQKRAQQYIDEGHHGLAQMPAMPMGDAFAVIPDLLKIESLIRSADLIAIDWSKVSDYWRDLMRMVQAHFAYVAKDSEQLASIKKHFTNQMYATYVDDRLARIPAASGACRTGLGA